MSRNVSSCLSNGNVFEKHFLNFNRQKLKSQYQSHEFYYWFRVWG